MTTILEHRTRAPSLEMDKPMEGENLYELVCIQVIDLLFTQEKMTEEEAKEFLGDYSTTVEPDGGLNYFLLILILLRNFLLIFMFYARLDFAWIFLK